MSHVFFFNYAHANKDKLLEAFFEDLCAEVAPHTDWGLATDPKTSFRDGQNLPLMEEWRPALLKALQTSAVLVAVTSPAYFQQRFCGQEYYIFDQRRRQQVLPGGQPPAVILPIIWVPLQNGLPDSIDKVQWQKGSMPALYETKGLRYLKKLQPAEYELCVTAFAEAIKDAWQRHKNIPELPNVAPFEDIPNAFAGGSWEEAAGPQGWLPGPGVANFVYAAGLSSEIPLPAGRYGAKSCDWRPYLPPVPSTIGELAKGVTDKQSLRYREIPIDGNLEAELQAARERKNLTVVVADPNTLPMQQYQPVTVFDKAPWEGTAVLMPWDGIIRPWDAQLEATVSSSFPIRSQSKAPPFQAPILTAVDLAKTLDITLTDLRAAVTQAGAKDKEKTDEPPAQVTGPSGADL